jgi:RecA/RadA recombinase
MRIRVTTKLKVSGQSEIDVLVVRLAEALVAAEELASDLSEADVTALARQRRVTVSIVVDSESWERAQARGASAVRNAIESIGGRVVTDAEPITAGLQARIRSTELVPA